MTDRSHHPDEAAAYRNWEGLAELDRALAENRLTEYRIKKAWADPIDRAVMIFVSLILAAYVGYVILNDFVR
jgi:hypothetical protein